MQYSKIAEYERNKRDKSKRELWRSLNALGLAAIFVYFSQGQTPLWSLMLVFAVLFLLAGVDAAMNSYAIESNGVCRRIQNKYKRTRHWDLKPSEGQ